MIVYISLASKIVFSRIAKMPPFRSWYMSFYCEIYSVFYKVNVRITLFLVKFQGKHLYAEAAEVNLINHT